MSVLKNNSGQVSMEFIVSVIMILMVFLFGLMIFQERSDFNTTQSISWQAEIVANKIARNINTIYLSDENTVLLDYIYWNSSNRRVVSFDRTVSVFHEFGFIDVPILAKTNFEVTDFNGAIIFEKNNGVVIVRNQ